MKIVLLIFAFVMLLSNLKGYKNLFKSQKDQQKELDNLLNVESKKIGGKENMKAYAVIVALAMSIIVIVFNIVVGLIVYQPLVIAWAALIILLTIKGFFKGVKSITEEKLSPVGAFYKLTRPVNTVYICYFIYYVMFVV
ncbi:hypothetical protein CHH83_01840 [Bacillus sp. 7586-K]|nr:hypothetical protein CHH83_01840 [Bacillus sp. 7586-K]